MVTHELLDEALKSLREYNYDKFKTNDGEEINQPMTAGELYVMFDIFKLDSFLILDHLVDEGYARYSETKSGDLDKDKYWVTYKGLLFLDSGGYKQKVIDSARTERRAKAVDYGIILAGVGAVISVVYLVCVALLRWTSYCCH